MSITSLINNNENNKITIKNKFIFSDDIKELILNKTIKFKEVKFINCEIEYSFSEGKVMSLLIKNFQFINCKFFVRNNRAINKLISNELSSKNVVINSTYLDYIIALNNNNLECLNEHEIKKISILGADLRGVVLPKNKNFFQLIKGKEVRKTKLPKINFHKYNISNTTFIDCKFHEDTILHDEFFQEIKHKKLSGCCLPRLYIKGKTIEGCSFEFTVFHKDTIFAPEIDLFQKFTLLYNCKFPIYDFRGYTFDNTNIRYCSFPEQCKLPYSMGLTKNIIENHYPKVYLKNLHILPIENMDLEELLFKYKDILSPIQETIIYRKLSQNPTNKCFD